MSTWGREFMWPDEIASEEIDGWISREAIPDPEEARRLAVQELTGMSGNAVNSEQIRLTEVLMREESEVEATINGHEAPYWVECTSRARQPEPFWRVEIKRAGTAPVAAAREGQESLEQDSS